MDCRVQIDDTVQPSRQRRIKRVKGPRCASTTAKKAPTSWPSTCGRAGSGYGDTLLAAWLPRFGPATERHNMNHVRDGSSCATSILLALLERIWLDLCLTVTTFHITDRDVDSEKALLVQLCSTPQTLRSSTLVPRKTVASFLSTTMANRVQLSARAVS